jgi:DNA-binding transcriptional ArsR family regulator
MLERDFLTMLSHPARLQALVLFERQPASATELAKVVDLSLSATCWHVRKLHEAGLIEQVDSRKQRAFEQRIWQTNPKGWADVERRLQKIATRANVKK